MLNYTLKRIILFFPTLIVITLLGFFISAQNPKNPLQTYSLQNPHMSFDPQSIQKLEEENRKSLAKYHLDKPVFYLGLSTQAEPDTLYKIYPSEHRKAAAQLAYSTGDWRVVHTYLSALKALKKSFTTTQVPASSHGTIQEALFFTQMLFGKGKKEEIQELITQLEMLCSNEVGLSPHIGLLTEVKAAWQGMESTRKPWNNFLPKLTWYGSESQYHIWIMGILTRFDFGISLNDGTSVSGKIQGRLFWTISLSVLSILMAYLVSIPLGLWVSLHKGKRIDKLSGLILFGLDAIPAFWMATMLRLVFSDPDIWGLFPPSFLTYLSPASSASSFYLLLSNFHFLVLPLFAYSYSMFAPMNRLLRASLLEQMHKPYMLTAKAKGLTRFQAVYRHALPNALLPMITLLGGVFPAMVSGSVILESIFEIPGLGFTALEAAKLNDVNVVAAILVLTGFMTLLGYLVSDILYAWLYPNIRLTKT